MKIARNFTPGNQKMDLDQNSIADYEEYLAPADLQFDIKHRHFQIEVDEESIIALCNQARKTRKPVKQLAGENLKRKLGTDESN